MQCSLIHNKSKYSHSQNTTTLWSLPHTLPKSSDSVGKLESRSKFNQRNKSMQKQRKSVKGDHNNNNVIIKHSEGPVVSSRAIDKILSHMLCVVKDTSEHQVEKLTI